MASKFYALLTTRGEAKLAQAVALGTQLKITQMAVGDGGGAIPTPNASQTKLVNQKRIAAINTLSVDSVNTSQIIAEQVIPEDEGGWWIREVGLFDDAGELIAIANCAETYKPQLAEGSGRTQVIRMIVIVSSTEAVTLKIDPSVVLATRKYVDDKVIEVKAYTDSVMKAHLDAADPHPQYAPKASPTFSGVPKAPTAAAGNNSTQLATTQFVQLAVAALVASSPAALDTLKELADALGNDPNFAATMTNQLALKANLASPALTGTPTAPTAAQTVSNTQIATTAFVKTALAALVDSSPAALDTLNELAAALGNDPDFATTMTNALALKAPLASPALSGTPTAPTAGAGSNTTQLANTAFVAAGLALKANLASPALSGIPTAPTAAQTVNNTQIATTAFVKSALAALVASAPASLDTLNELSAALGNDPNFSTTVINALAGKQAIDDTLTALSGKNVASLLEYLGLTSVGLAGVSGGVIGTSGYITLPMVISGERRVLYIQWGSFSGSTSSSAGADGVYENSNISVTWPVAFPNNILQVITGGSSDVGGAGVQEMAWNLSKSKSTGIFGVQCRVASAAMTGSYLAIGY